MDTLNNIKSQFDIALLNKKKPISNDKDDLRKVAEEFESLFINEMLKRAHSAKLAKTMLSSDAEVTYTSMLNQERSKIMAKSKKNYTRWKHVIVKTPRDVFAKAMANLFQ